MYSSPDLYLKLVAVYVCTALLVVTAYAALSLLASWSTIPRSESGDPSRPRRRLRHTRPVGAAGESFTQAGVASSSSRLGESFGPRRVDGVSAARPDAPRATK